MASDLRAIQKGYPRLRQHAYLLGNRLRCEAYQESLRAFFNSDTDYSYLGENSMEEAAKRGAFRIAVLRTKLGQDHDS